jgi:hypothetical protein
MTGFFVVAYFVVLVVSFILTAKLARRKGYSPAWAFLAFPLGILVVFGFIFLPRRTTTRVLTPEMQRRSIKVIPPDEQGRYRS